MVIASDDSLPHYLRIRDALRRQIESGAYAEGARLPSERELADAFGVSRMTARQALRLLVQDGVINARVGKGTFVQRPHFDQELRDLTSFTDDMRRVGARPASRVVLAEVGPADGEVAAHLEVDAGREVVRLQRVRLADGEVIALERAYIPHALCPGILEANNFARQSLYSALRDQYGLRLVWASEVITARMPDEEERAALELAEGVPVLGMKRVTYDEHDRPVEYVRSCYHSQRYQLRTVLRDNSRSTGSGG
jgi:GntR family transcriptional regulator